MFDTLKTSAYMIEEELKEQLRKKQEALKHFQRQVKRRVNQQIRLRKKQELQKSYEAAEKEGSIAMHSSNPSHLTPKRTSVFPNTLNAAVGSAGLPPSQMLEDGIEDRENQNELFQQQAQALSQTMKQARHQLASFKTVNKKNAPVFPDDRKKSFPTQEEVPCRKPAFIKINIGTSGKLPFEVQQDLLTPVHDQIFMEDQESDSEESPSIMIDKKGKENLSWGDQQDLLSEDKDITFNRVQKVQFKNPLSAMTEEKEVEQLRQDILPKAQDYLPEAQGDLLQSQGDLIDIQSVELEAWSVEPRPSTQDMELEGQAVKPKAQAVKAKTRSVLLKTQSVELEEGNIVLEGQGFLPPNQAFLHTCEDFSPKDQNILLECPEQDFLPKDQCALPRDQHVFPKDQNILPTYQDHHFLTEDQNILPKCEDQDFLPKDQHVLSTDPEYSTQNRCQDQNFLPRDEKANLKQLTSILTGRNGSEAFPLDVHQDLHRHQDEAFTRGKKVRFKESCCDMTSEKERDPSLAGYQYLPPKLQDQAFIRDEIEQNQKEIQRDKNKYSKQPSSFEKWEIEKGIASGVPSICFTQCSRPSLSQTHRNYGQASPNMTDEKWRKELFLEHHEYVLHEIQNPGSAREQSLYSKQQLSFGRAEQWQDDLLLDRHHHRPPQNQREVSIRRQVGGGYQSGLNTEYQTPLAFQSGVNQEEDKKDRQKQYLRYRRLFMDIEREQVKEQHRQKEQRKKIEKIKKKKEQQRYAEEQRILRMNFPEEPCSGEKMSEILAQLQLEEVKGARVKQQREKEHQRYVEALRAQIQEKMQLYNITLPPLCCCGPDFWDAHPDTCANNCIFYKNHRAYNRALHSVINSCDIPEGNSTLRTAIHNFASAHRRTLKNL
ncbi:Coiled-coil domain-containing protein 15 [Camelus dromedarius]|uniref:Coiled-coil domain-containing protein 15 n=1 Tax=Camelus dromedarius TaxID=9838 RepID=A0A5N4C6W8_CAMDR|nr:Coiled-coil domain-containing protein 15 [Camelus dromedarius]